jgi:hypothetical protein
MGLDPHFPHLPLIFCFSSPAAKPLHQKPIYLQALPDRKPRVFRRDL